MISNDNGRQISGRQQRNYETLTTLFIQMLSMKGRAGIDVE